MKKDTHHHFIPEVLKKYVADLPEWSAEQTLAFLDEKGLDAAVLSLSPFDIDFATKEEYVDFCHKVNLELKFHADRYPGRIEALGILPFPHVDSCIKELRTCVTYGFSGVVLYTNYKGVYPSSLDHEPLFRELEECRGKVFLHPGTEVGTDGVENGGAVPRIEESYDVSRLISRLFAEDAFERFPGIRYVLGQGGGIFPYQFSRICKLVYFKNSGDDLKMRWGRIIGDLVSRKIRVLDYLNRIEIDLFDFDRPEQLAALRANVPEKNWLYGSNYPFAG